MSFIFADRVKETSTTTGAGTLSMAGAVTGFQTFVNGIGTGNTCAYLIDDGNGNWELTYGVITSGTPATLTRGTLINSSTGSRITFVSGSKTVTVVPAAELLLWAASSAVLVETTIASATTTDLGSITTLRALISGTTTITGFGTQPKSLRIVRFSGTLTLTHNATSLILLTGQSRAIFAGDIGIYVSDGSGNWTEISFSDGSSEGTWTVNDQSGAALTFTSVNCKFSKKGRAITVNAAWTYPSTASGANAILGGLPFTSANTGPLSLLNAFGPGGGGVAISALVNSNTTTFSLYDGGGTARTNSNNSTRTVYVSGTYFI